MMENKMSDLVGNIIAMKPALYRTLGKPVSLNSGITPGAYYCMLYLKKHNSLSMSDLGKILLISKPNVTALINKLIAKGLVVRSSDKQDRRVIMIRLSSKGIQFMEKNIKKHMKQIIVKLTTLSDNELNLLSESLQNVKNILSKIAVSDSNELKN